jgi:hypothetical protein
MPAGMFQPDMLDWETIWAPYDEGTYQDVLVQIYPYDIVLDIGAGDLRLALRMASLCERVYAIELQEQLLKEARKQSNQQLPENLIFFQADARSMPFPDSVTTGVLLMRHCTHFKLYADKLKAVGAGRLITNARWRSGIEVIPLQSERMPYADLNLGWYACWCGAAGFKPGPLHLLSPELESQTHEVLACPQCSLDQGARTHI